MGKKVLGDVSLGQVVTNGVVAGIANVIKSKNSKKDFPNGFVAGGLARGGSSEAPNPYTFEFGEAADSDTAGEPLQQTVEDPTVAAQLAQEIGGPVEAPKFQAPPQGGIAGLLAARGDIPGVGQQGPPPINGAPQPPARGGLVPANAGIAGSPFQDRPANISQLVGA
jgi:hypothetical protein